jgi:hypothetical protein
MTFVAVCIELIVHWIPYSTDNLASDRVRHKGDVFQCGPGLIGGPGLLSPINCFLNGV